MSGAGQELETTLLRAVFDSVGAGMFVIDSAGRIIASNPHSQRLLDRSEEELFGADLHDLLHRDANGNKVPRQECPALSVLDTGRPTEGSEHFYLRGDGTLIPIIWVVTPLQQGDGAGGAVIVFHDFRKHRDASEQTAAHLAALEELTGRLSLVAEVSVLLISSPNTDEVLDRLARLLVPDLGDWAVIDVLPKGRDSDEIHRVAVHSLDDDDTAEALKGPLPPLSQTSRSALAHALYSLEPVLLDAGRHKGGSNEPLAQAHRQLFEHLGEGTALVVPMYTRRGLYGALTVARTGARSTFDEAEVLLLSDIARRIALVIKSNRLFEQQRDMAETLQRQLLTPLPQVDRLRFAARYQPARQASEVGGDWYDAFLLADGATALVIGDVVGHDLHAAAHMAEVRNMLRALAWDRQEPPAEIVRRLDDVMTHTSDAPMATAVFARIEGPDGGPWHLHWANAGHPPPLLITADGHARYLENGHGPLLGMSSALKLGLEWPDNHEELPERSTLLLYTDGLVERRGQDLDKGLENLRRHAADLIDHDLEDFLDELLARIEPEGDDVALLALRLPALGEGRAEDDVAPPQHAHSPAAPDRRAPGAWVEGSLVRNTSDPA